jgi:hypothetical protein
MAKMTAETILQRWDRIRNNPKCELSLEPEAVASFLRQPESAIVQNRIREALVDLVYYRLKKGKFESENPAGSGDLATCEGLETFLVPAVEEAVAFSELLAAIPNEKRGEFVEAMLLDIKGLVKNWTAGVFSGAPYGNPAVLRNALRPSLKDELGEINNVEAAAFACRVLVHLMTLLTRGEDEKIFADAIGSKLSVKDLLQAQANAITYLVKSFQKGEAEDERQGIVEANIDGKPGSGWSWTALPDLPPMLFFTAAAVDAFAELDLYLIRPMVKKSWSTEGVYGELVKFYIDNKVSIENLQLCVDMARRWIEGSVLPYLSRGIGQYLERLPLEPKPYATESPNYGDDFRTRSKAIEEAFSLRDPPIVYYNNIYSLLILLWSYADWDVSGEAVNPTAKAAIDRALAQIVQRHATPEIHDFLNRFPNVFYLPGEQIFEDGRKARCEYLDSAFLPLLTRLLVLFVVYGVGDRNLLEPAIRNLYVELLQGRDRSGDYSGLWSEASIELYSSQRAVQALTFYYAYARGRELLLSSGEQGSGLIFRNFTGAPLVLEARFLSEQREPDQRPPAPDNDDKKRALKELLDKTNKGFAPFCKKLPGFKGPKMVGLDPEKDKETYEFFQRIEQLGERAITEVREGRIDDAAEVNSLLTSLCELLLNHQSKDREKTLKGLQERYETLSRD